MSTGTFIRRPVPLPGESLSSLRQRLGLANGLRLFPISKGTLRRIDPDTLPGDQELGWLSCASGVDPAELRSLSLQAFSATVFRGEAARKHPPWLLQAKYGADPFQRHVTYCAACLRKPPTYFRLHWRLACFTICPVHQIWLRDCCPQCGRRVWPAPATSPWLFNDGDVLLGQCAYCLCSLGDVQDQPCASEQDCYFRTALEFGMARLPSGKEVGAEEYFAALRTVCQVFLRQSSRDRIAASDSRWSALAQTLRTLDTPHHVEQLSLEPRHGLIRAAYEILMDWPGSFVEFAEKAGISYVHVSVPGDKYPDWFHEVADQELRLQRRDISRSKVEDAIAVVVGRGDPLHKAAIQRELGGTYASVVEGMLGRRCDATADELHRVLAGYSQERARLTGRRSVRITLLRDHVVFYLAVLSGQTFDQVLARPKRQLSEDIADLGRAPSNSMRRWIIHELAQAWSEYLQVEFKMLGQAAPAASLHCLRRGTGVRPAQARLRRHMRDLDPRLWRCVCALWKPAAFEAPSPAVGL